HTKCQVLRYRQRRKDIATLGYISDTCTRNAVSRHSQQLLSVEQNRATRLHQPHHCLHQRRSSGSITPQHTDDLASLDVHINASQHMTFAIPCLQIPDLEQSCHDTSSRIRSPRYACCTCWLARMFSGVSQAINSP